MPGESRIRYRLPERHRRFNPRPALMPGESLGCGWRWAGAWWFQSTPGINAGRIRCALWITAAAGETFQSTPGINAGRIRPKGFLGGALGFEFQSTPGINAGRILPNSAH